MTFSPRGVGDQSPIHNAFTVDGGVIFSLSNINPSSMAMHFVNVANGSLTIGTGSWTIISGPNGLADYNPSAADIATAGTYKVYPVIELSTGPKPFDPQILELENLR